MRQAERDLRDEGVPRDRIRIERFLDMRYCGQSYEITVEYGESFGESFHRAHERIYGYREEERDTEIVNVRVRGTGSTETPSFPKREEVGPDPSMAFEGKRRIVESGVEREASIYRRDDLVPGNHLLGPSIVVEYSSTVYVPSGWECRVDRGENLLLRPRGEGT